MNDSFCFDTHPGDGLRLITPAGNVWHQNFSGRVRITADPPLLDGVPDDRPMPVPIDELQVY